jgi:hypothetical protein
MMALAPFTEVEITFRPAETAQGVPTWWCHMPETGGWMMWNALEVPSIWDVLGWLAREQARRLPQEAVG